MQKLRVPTLGVFAFAAAFAVAGCEQKQQEEPAPVAEEPMMEEEAPAEEPMMAEPATGETGVTDATAPEGATEATEGMEEETSEEAAE